MSVKRLVLATAGAAALILAAGAAQAGDGSVRPPNYTFPAGLSGFRLTSHGGPANPGILVGFNPQPEPPGDFVPTADGSVRPQTWMDLTDPTRPVLFNFAPTDAFSLHFRITGHGDGTIEPPEPERTGHIEFFHTLDGHRFDITFDLGPGGIDPASWVAFNPQPDPPGIGFGVNFNFAGGGAGGLAPQSVDGHAFAFSIKLDGQDLSFAAAPEPASWAMMITGFGMGGAVLRRRRRLATA
jgi:hypothetical protein